jgi:hypothetical protein
MPKDMRQVAVEALTAELDGKPERVPEIYGRCLVGARDAEEVGNIMAQAIGAHLALELALMHRLVEATPGDKLLMTPDFMKATLREIAHEWRQEG